MQQNPPQNNKLKQQTLQQQLGNAANPESGGFQNSMPMVRDSRNQQRNFDRAIKDPKKAFGALSKLAKNLSPEQQQQLQKGMNNIMGRRFDRSGGAEPGSMIGQDIGGLNAANQAANIFGNFTGRDELKKLRDSMPRKGNRFGPKGGGIDFKAHADSLDDHREGYSYKGINSKDRKAGEINKLLGQMGLLGPERGKTSDNPGGRKMWDDPIPPGQPGLLPMPGQPGINPPGPPPVGINPPPGQPPIGFPPGPPGVMGQPSLNLGQIQGTMGMVGQPPQPPSLAQTAAAQTTPASVAAAGATGTALPATPGTGQATSTPAPTGQPAAAGRGTPAAPASTTPTPTATSANTSPVTGPVTAPQIQNAIGQSPVLNQPVHNNQDMFQGMYGGMINMPGQAEVAAQANTPGRSFVGNQFGQGGMVNNQMQQLQANAAQQGIQNATQMIGTNVQHGLQQDQTLAGMDFAQRQAGVQGLTDLLSPQLAGTAAGYQQGLQGLARTPQFMGF
jgi:hypothetical protein